ncbi:uncharacterized protein [Oscarella lobularis]|uniref:uncharacterized protein n=1 Tax=Oscarella lobularis TaxID=121494 RepID=UPI0033134FDA
MENSKTKAVESLHGGEFDVPKAVESDASSLDGGEFDDALPGGIYNLKPHMYPQGYLTYRQDGVTGRGKKPNKPKCRWTLSDPVEGKQWIRTLVSNVTTPYLSIKDNALLTAPYLLSLPASYYFRALDMRPDETDTGGEEVMKFQSDVNQSHYIGVDESGFVVPPAIAGSNPRYARFITTEVAGFSSLKKDFDQEIVQIVSTGTDKAISIESEGPVFLSTKDNETTHLKAISSGQDNVLYTFQGVKHPSLNLRIRAKDGKMIADEKPTRFAILKATVPGEETADDVYVLYSPADHEFVCVKEDGHLELDPNPLPPSESSEPLTKGPGFFHIEILSK